MGEIVPDQRDGIVLAMAVDDFFAIAEEVRGRVVGVLGLLHDDEALRPHRFEDAHVDLVGDAAMEDDLRLGQHPVVVLEVHAAVHVNLHALGAELHDPMHRGQSLALDVRVEIAQKRHVVDAGQSLVHAEGGPRAEVAKP